MEAEALASSDRTHSRSSILSLTDVRYVGRADADGVGIAVAAVRWVKEAFEFGDDSE